MYKIFLTCISYCFFRLILMCNISSQPRDTTVIIQFHHQLDKQNTITKIYDTIFPKSLNKQNLLIGTAILYGSKNNWKSCFLDNLYFEKVEFSECMSEPIF
jgi:hypothetical protein